MQSILRLVLTGGALCVATSVKGTPHLVTMRIESLTRQPTRVHVVADSAGLWLRGDSTYRAEITIDTPNDVMVGPRVSRLELRTDYNQPVRVQFTDGATEGEKRLHPWGWLMSFRRINGDLQPVAKVLPAEPAVARRN